MGMVDSLRMNNIYAPSGGAAFSGPPDMNGGSGMGNPNDIVNTIHYLRNQSKDADHNRQKDLLNFQSDLERKNKYLDSKLQLGNSNQPTQGGPMNTILNYPDDDRRRSMQMTEYQRAMVDMNKQKLGVTDENADQKLLFQQHNADANRGIAQQRADAYTRGMSLHDMTDSEKQAVIAAARRGDIEAQGILATALEEQRQSGRETIAGMNNEGAMERIIKSNEGRANVAGANNATDEKIAGINHDSSNKNSYLPTQQRVAAANAARQIMNTRPELGKWITLDQAGNPTVQPAGAGTNWFTGSPTGPTKEQFDEINRIIYGASGPPQSPTYKNVPTDGTASLTPPTAQNMPAAPNSPTTPTPYNEPRRVPSMSGTQIPNSRFKATVR